MRGVASARRTRAYVPRTTTALRSHAEEGIRAFIEKRDPTWEDR
jgi:hypothetical protein